VTNLPLHLRAASGLPDFEIWPVVLIILIFTNNSGDILLRSINKVFQEEVKKPIFLLDADLGPTNPVLLSYLGNVNF
jgi:hypothetical protein